MNITYLPHARERMQQRHITEAMVEQVLADPDESKPADKGRTKYIKAIEGEGKVSVVALIRKLSDRRFVVYTVF